MCAQHPTLGMMGNHSPNIGRSWLYRSKVQSPSRMFGSYHWFYLRDWYLAIPGLRQEFRVRDRDTSCLTSTLTNGLWVL